MKTSLLSAAIVLMATTSLHSAAADPVTALEEKVDKELNLLFKDMGSYRTSEVWKRFSTRSKGEYRAAYNEYVKGLTEEDRTDELKRRGFFNSFEKVRAMSDENFWEDFIIDQAVQEKEAKPTHWLEENVRIPEYKLCAATRRSETVYIIISVPIMRSATPFDALNSPRAPAWKSEEDTPWGFRIGTRMHIVLTGIERDGRFFFDVPEMTINHYKWKS